MSQGIRVLYPFVGDSVGGSHISTLTLIRQLARHDVTPLLAVHQKGQLSAHLENVGMTWLNPPRVPIIEGGSFLRQVTNMLRGAVPLALWLRSLRPDIVHTNDIRMHLTWVLACRMSGLPSVWHQRTPCMSRRFGLYSLLTTRVVTISEYCRANLPAAMRKRTGLIPNPVELADVGTKDTNRRRVLEELGCRHDTLIVGWFANAIERKRPFVFLEMAEQVIENFSGAVVFPMFGKADGPLSDKLRTFIQKRGLEGHVFFMGSRIPVEPYISACDVIAATAVREGFGRTLVEAMLTETPVVASNDGGHVEILEGGRFGRLVPPDDPRALANAVLETLGLPPDVRSRARSARLEAQVKYTAGKHADQVVSVYRECLPSSS